MMLEVPPTASKGGPSMIHDEEHNTWGVAAPLQVLPKGETDTVPLPVQLVVIGVAAV